jgi:hypothetical protein
MDADFLKEERAGSVERAACGELAHAVSSSQLQSHLQSSPVPLRLLQKCFKQDALLGCVKEVAECGRVVGDDSSLVSTPSIPPVLL